MRKHIATYIDNVITVLLFAAAALTPLFFLNLTTEYYEIPKLILLLVLGVVLLGLWIFSWILKGKVVITRTPLDIPLLILLVAIIASAFFSESKYAVIYGNFPRVHGSVTSWVVYILLYFITVSHLKSISRINGFLYALYGSGVVVSVVTLLSFFGIYLPFDFASTVNFTPTGSSFSTVAFLLLLLPLPLISILSPNKNLPTSAAIILAILFSVTIVFVGSITSYVAMLLAYGICLLIPNPHKTRKALSQFLIPVFVAIVAFALAYFPLPNGINKIQQLEAAFPKEIQLPFGVSWKISVSSFRDAPIIGSGPSTYQFNFTSYKPLEYNQLRYWNISFDTAYNEYLQMLGTIGGLGVLAIVIFSLVVLNSSRRNLSLKTDIAHHEDHQARVLVSGFAISALLTIVLLAVHSTTLVSIVMTFMILALFMASQRSIRERVMELSLGLRASTADNKQFDLLPVIIFILFLVGAFPLLYKTFNVVLADYYHRLALRQANVNGTQTYEYLQKAESLNPEIDLYRVDMAQTNFALANALAVQKGPSADNPEGSLTDQDRATIQTLLSQAVNEGRAAVILNPLSTRNWEILASIYRNITGVAQNALAFSLDANGRAIQRDPFNPALRVNVGGLYYSIKNYDLAIRFFTDAANIKPDYANAYYNLAIAYRDKGELQNAQLVAEKTVSLLAENKESADYKTALALLNDLKDKNKESTTQAPAAAASSALQNPDLPDVEVNELQEAPSVTPVPSVRPNPTAGIPQLTPQPTGGLVPTGGLQPTSTPLPLQ